MVPQASFGDSVISSRSVLISRLFGVSPKAVRDIWNERTWRHSTSSLSLETEMTSRTEHLKAVEDMTSQLMTMQAPSKVVGRPRGSKDSKPRKARRQHRNDVKSNKTQFLSQEFSSFGNFHKSEWKCTSMAQSDPSTPPESTIQYQSTARAQFNPVSHIHTAVAEPCMSMPHWDHSLAHDAACAEEGEEACLRRSYPFFLQW